jgi:putative ABC transport system permease protein
MLSNYLKIAFKVLMRRKFYTFVSLFGIAFTLLILNVAVAMLDHILAPVAPETRLDRILSIENAQLSGENRTSSGPPGYALLDQYARDLPGVEKMSIVTRGEKVTSFVDGQKLLPHLRRTDGVFWEIMEYEFIEGAPYTAADVERGEFVAVVNETTRERFFDGEPALGQTLRADDQAFTVVGVVRDVPITRRLSFSEIWVPTTTAKSTAYRTQLRGGHTGILLAENRSQFRDIQDEFQSRLAAAQLPQPDVYDEVKSGAYTPLEHMAVDMFNQPYTDRAPTRSLLLVFAALGLLFMLLPILNLVNLSLSRILERASEIGVRKAFGASSRTLVGQFLIESVVLTLIGGLIGLGLSVLLLRSIGNVDAIPYADLTLNYRIFFYGLALAVIFGVLSGAYPAWRMSRMHPVEALHGRTR